MTRRVTGLNADECNCIEHMEIKTHLSRRNRAIGGFDKENDGCLTVVRTKGASSEHAPKLEESRVLTVPIAGMSTVQQVIDCESC